MKRLMYLGVLLLVTGCSSAPPVPDWLNASSNQLETYKKSYLGGKDKIAALQFKSAVAEVKKSGDLEVLGRTYLIRMALETAVLADMENAEYLKIATVSPNRQNGNFYFFLNGKLEQTDVDLLPSQYRDFASALKSGGGPGDRLRAIEKMNDPLSRLIAIGILVRLHQDDEALLKKAVETASAQGWKKALLVYLSRLKSLHEAKQDRSQAQAVSDRLELIRD